MLQQHILRELYKFCDRWNCGHILASFSLRSLNVFFWLVDNNLFKPGHSNRYNLVCTSIEHLDQPAFTRSLIKFFALGTLEWVTKIPIILHIVSDESFLYAHTTLYLMLYIDSYWPRCTVGSVTGNRCESDCRSRGRKFDPGPVSYFRGD